MQWVSRRFLSCPFFLGVFLALSPTTQASFNLLDSLKEEDIQQSIGRLKQLTSGNYAGTIPILQDNSPIGGIRCHERDIYISFQDPFRDDFVENYYMTELNSCAGEASPCVAESLVGLPGKVYSKFYRTLEAIKEDVRTHIMNYAENKEQAIVISVFLLKAIAWDQEWSLCLPWI